MNSMQMAVLAVLGIALASIAGCTGGGNPTPQTQGVGHGEGPGANQHFGQMHSRDYQVYIYTPDPNHRDQCLLDWPVAILWKNANQTVTWFSDDNYEYTVDFGTKSPFSSSTFDVPMGASVNSGALQSAATGYYPFSIHAGDKNGTVCKKANDPDPGYYVK